MKVGGAWVWVRPALAYSPEMGILSWTVSAWRMRWRESATTCGHQKMSRVSQEHVTDVILHL